MSGPLQGPARWLCRFHHATQTFGLCAVVLTQVKAVGLVQVYDLPS
jgi:hypothetical protein